MPQTSTPIRAELPTKSESMQKSQNHHEGQPGPRATTLAVLRQFARNYCPTPIAGITALGGVVLN